jgi:hypothetical protein
MIAGSNIAILADQLSIVKMEYFAVANYNESNAQLIKERL